MHQTHCAFSSVTFCSSVARLRLSIFFRFGPLDGRLHWVITDFARASAAAFCGAFRLFSRRFSL